MAIADRQSAITDNDLIVVGYDEEIFGRIAEQYPNVVLPCVAKKRFPNRAIQAGERFGVAAKDVKTLLNQGDVSVVGIEKVYEKANDGASDVRAAKKGAYAIAKEVVDARAKAAEAAAKAAEVPKK